MFGVYLRSGALAVLNTSDDADSEFFGFREIPDPSETAVAFRVNSNLFSAEPSTCPPTIIIITFHFLSLPSSL
jgi:hypothetical protein